MYLILGIYKYFIDNSFFTISSMEIHSSINLPFPIQDEELEKLKTANEALLARLEALQAGSS
jgi:hypothetical protein